MTEKLKTISKDSVLPISISLLIALVAGVWSLAFRVSRWEHRLERIEERIGNRWTYYMERESWREFSARNTEIDVPDVQQIRNQFQGPP